MSTMISVKKGVTNTLTVIISFGVSLLSVYLANKIGIQIPDEMTETIIVTGTAFLTGLVHGAQNYFKHKPKASLSNLTDNKSPDLPQV